MDISGNSNGGYRIKNTIIPKRIYIPGIPIESYVPDSDPEDRIASILNKKEHWQYLEGYPDGSFKPDNYISRAEVTKVTNLMLDRKCDLDFVKRNKDAINYFTDVREDYWAYADICEATNGHDYRRKNSEFIDEIWESLNHLKFSVNH